MNLPKFLIADNSELENDIFVLHTEYPRFLINVTNDEVEWFDHVKDENKDELTEEMTTLIEDSLNFYDQEMEKYENS